VWYSDEGLATSLALHYLELNRASRSDLKAIVVMGSMGKVDHTRSWVASHTQTFKRLGVVFPVPQCIPPANTRCSGSLVLLRPRSRAGVFA